MACALLLRLVRVNVLPGVGLVLPTMKFSPTEQRRTIVNKALLKLPDDYPEAWDYKEYGLV